MRSFNALFLVVVAAALSPSVESKPKHVIMFIADGLMSHAMQRSGVPHFKELMDDGACTLNARIQYSISQTLPTMISMVTGLSVTEHKHKDDKDNRQALRPRVQNVFDLVHAKNGKTCMFVSKEKLELIKRSFDVDVYHYNKNGKALTQKFLSVMKSSNPCTVSFVHVKEIDTWGHKKKGEGDEYHRAVREVDGYLGSIMDWIKNTGRKDDFALLMTADHGFGASNHADQKLYKTYKIPFCAWGGNAARGKELYTLNKGRRTDPIKGRPGNSGPQPIRNSDIGPLAADLLGVSPQSGRFGRDHLKISGGGTRSQEVHVPAPAPSPTPAAKEGCMKEGEMGCSRNADCCGKYFCRRSKLDKDGNKVPPYCTVNVATTALTTPAVKQGCKKDGETGCSRNVDCCDNYFCRRNKLDEDGKRVPLKNPYCTVNVAATATAPGAKQGCMKEGEMGCSKDTDCCESYFCRKNEWGEDGNKVPLENPYCKIRQVQ